jgi:hypothetical protein
MNQLTIRGFGPSLERKIRQLARAEGISLNKAALKLMRKGAGLGDEHSEHDIVGDSLDHLIGTWSPKEAEEFDVAVEDLSHVDLSMWSK